MASLAAAALLGAGAGSARATALELYGFGPRAAGMGLTGTAAVEGNYAVYYNPAALASLEGIRLDAGYQVAPTRLTMNGRSVGAKSPRATEVGLGFGVKTFGMRSGLGLALHVPDYGLYGVRLRPVDAPQFVLVDPRRDRIHVMAGYAIAPVDKVEVGFSASLLSDTLALLSLDQGTKQQGSIDAQLIPTNTLHAGVRVGPWSGMRAGLTYRDEHISIVSFPTDLHAEIGTVSGDVLVRSRSFVYYTPRQVSLGGSWETGDVLATADLTWSGWSGMRDPNGSSGFLVIDRNGNLPPQPPPNFQEDPKFKDTVSPHLGLEWRALRGGKVELTARGGYAFEKSPAPAPTATRNLVDLDRHVLTAGGRVRFPKAPGVGAPVDLDGYVVYGRLGERTVRRDDPTDPVGSYTAGGELWAVGMATTVHFDAAYLRGQ